MNRPAGRQAAEALQSLLRYAHEHIPWYQRQIPEGAVTDLRSCPTTDRRTRNEFWPQFLSEEYTGRALQSRYTSGTTGQPLRILFSPAESVVAARTLNLARARTGLQGPLRPLFIQSWWDDMGETAPVMNPVPGLESVAQTYRYGREEALRITTPQFAERDLLDLARTIEEFRPNRIITSPSAVDPLINQLLEVNRALRLPRECQVELQAEPANAATRHGIRRAFGCEPRSLYGCQEVWAIAMECAKGRLHLIEDSVWLEILGAEGAPAADGEFGEVLVTSLNLRAMPFIRYKLGDLARFVPGNCRCGDTARAIELRGARAAQVVAGAGLLGNLFFEAVVETVASAQALEIRAFRVIQRSRREFDVLLESDAKLPRTFDAAFRRLCRPALGNDALFRFRRVPSVPPLGSGKMLSFISQVTE